jgi:transposase
MNTEPLFDLLIGLDRSDRQANLHLIHPRTGERQSLTRDTSPAALWEWLLPLRQQHPETRVGLCLEQPAGHLLSFLEAYEWITLYPINPITLKKYREAFVTSRAKDDGQDARYLAERLWHDADKRKAWAPEDRATRAVQQRVFHRRAQESILWSRGPQRITCNNASKVARLTRRCGRWPTSGNG